MHVPLFCIVVSLGAEAMAQEAPPPFAAFDLACAPILNDPHDLTIGLDGNLYVADKFGNRLVVLDPETLELVDVLGDGSFPGIHDVSFDATGRLVIAVTYAGAVVVFDDITHIAEPPALVLSATRTEGALAHSNGRIYAMASGIGALLAYDGPDIVAVAEGHAGAHDVAEDGDGNIWIADTAQRRLVKYGPDLNRLQVIDAPKFGFGGPRYLDIDAADRLVVADQDAHRILLIDPNGPEGGTLLGVLGTRKPGMGPNVFDDPEGVVAAGSRYYISDSDNNRVVRYSVVLN